MNVPAKALAFRDGFLVFERAGALPGHALQKLIDQIKQLDMDKLVSILTEGWDEFENFDATKLVESVTPKPVASPVKPPETVTESEEDAEEDTGEIHMLTEDFNGDKQVVTIEDLDESDEQK
jgi:hypothetical protein